MGLVLGNWKQAWLHVVAKPFLALAIVVTLGLGIGASSTVFSFVYGMLLRPYPYADPGRLVRVQTVATKAADNVRGVSIPDLEASRARTSTAEALGAYLPFPNTLTAEGQAHAVNLTFLDARTFPLLGVNPILGREGTCNNASVSAGWSAPASGGRTHLVYLRGSESSPQSGSANTGVLAYDLARRAIAWKDPATGSGSISSGFLVTATGLLLFGDDSAFLVGTDAVSGKRALELQPGAEHRLAAHQLCHRRKTILRCHSRQRRIRILGPLGRSSGRSSSPETRAACWFTNLPGSL